MIHKGRIPLYTDVPEITYENVIDVVRKCIPNHETNALDSDELIRYDKGEQPKIRDKQKRKDIDIWCIDNVANEISKFHIGYKWGIPITIVQRGEKDKGKQNEIEAISLLNECYESESIRKKTQELARFVEICGVGYTYVGINMEWEKGDSYFTVDVLEPQTTFIIHSSYYRDKRPMLGVTYRKDSQGNRFFTCYSKDRRFDIKNLMEIENGKVVSKEKSTWGHEMRSGEENPLHKIPIIEWIRDFDRMGCFERQMDDMNCLNLIESDVCNATDEAVQAIWHCNDVDFPTEIIKTTDENGNEVEKEVVRRPKNNEWMQTYTTQDGKTPFVTPLAANFDYEGNLNYALAKRALILQKGDVPSRGGSSGGNTGLALDTASGASNTEAIASAQQNIEEGCKMEEIKVALAAIKESPFIEPDNSLLTLKYRDVQPNIKRNKSYEMSTKINTWATAVSHGMNGYHALRMVNIVDDPNQVWADSEKTVTMYQMNTFGNQNAGNNAVGDNGESKPNSDRIMQDISDQEENSPNLSGKATRQEN